MLNRLERINLSAGLNLYFSLVFLLQGNITRYFGFTAIAEKSLTSLAATLNKKEKEVSLEIDKMGIDPNIKQKQWGRIVGQVNKGGVRLIQMENTFYLTVFWHFI